MHMLACDPGIIAIMNKVKVPPFQNGTIYNTVIVSDTVFFLFHLSQHRWRVGIMTEMAPVGYVGISPKCILGFNKVVISSHVCWKQKY